MLRIELGIAQTQTDCVAKKAETKRNEMAIKLDLCLKAFSFNCITIASVCFFEFRSIFMDLLALASISIDFDRYQAWKSMELDADRPQIDSNR